MAVYGGPDIVTDGLILHLDAGNSKSYPGSGNIWYDLSGNNRNFNLVGSLVYDGFYFDGFNDSNYVSGSSYSHRNDDYTYSVWFMYDVLTGYATIFENGSWSDTLLYRSYNSIIQVYAEGGYFGQHSFGYTTNQWYNVVLRRQSSISQSFVNGIAGNSLSLNRDINLANQNMFLLRSQHTTNQFTNGKLSVFSLYDKALSDSQILENYYAVKGRFGL